MADEEAKKEILEILAGRDNSAAHSLARRIISESECSDEFYCLVPDLFPLLSERSSFVRTRAFLLICGQARWDSRKLIPENIDALCALLEDGKPSVVRQCVSSLRTVVQWCPELRPRIRDALRGIDPGRYADTMSPLIESDVRSLLAYMDGL